MTKKFTQLDIKTYLDKRAEFHKMKDQLDNRVVEIMFLIAKVFGKKLQSCWYYNAAEGEMGELNITCISTNCDDEQIDVELWFKNKEYEEMETNNWDYTQGFPKRFLWMDNKEIESLLLSEIKETKRLEQEAKIKKQKDKEAEEEKIKLAKNKLSKQELKLLGIK